MSFRMKTLPCHKCATCKIVKSDEDTVSIDGTWYCFPCAKKMEKAEMKTAKKAARERKLAANAAKKAVKKKSKTSAAKPPKRKRAFRIGLFGF